MRASLVVCACFSTTLTIAVLMGVDSPAASADAQPEKAPGAGDPLPKAARDLTPILKAAEEFKTWKRVSEQIWWAPALCRAMLQPQGPVPDPQLDTHSKGRKLYYVYAKDGDAYFKTSYGRTRAEMDAAAMNGVPLQSPAGPEGDAERASPVGQIVVKQTFVPVEMEKPAPGTLDFTPREQTAEIGGKKYKAGDAGPLFVMMKLEPGAKDSDNGWVYATLTPDGKTVTESGAIASCVKCHETTGRDRLYGVRQSWPVDGKTHEFMPPVQGKGGAGGK